MLPAAFQMPASAVLLLGGVVSCFFGYRLFRVVLAIFATALYRLSRSALTAWADVSIAAISALAVG